MLERYHNIGGHLRLDPEGTLTSYADAQATIADLQGQVEAARKKVEEMNAWVSAMSTANIATMTHTSEMQERALEAEQRVAQLEGHQQLHDRIYARQKVLIDKYCDTIKEAIRRLHGSTHSVESPEPYESRTPVVAAFLETALGFNAEGAESELTTLQADHARVLGLVQAYFATKDKADSISDNADCEEWREAYRAYHGAADALRASLPAQPAQGGAKCVWVDDGGDKYATGCNKYLQVYAESEEAQQWVKFCCYCGKPVEHFEAADVEGGA